MHATEFIDEGRIEKASQLLLLETYRTYLKPLAALALTGIAFPIQAPTMLSAHSDAIAASASEGGSASMA
ncbi:MAG: hypothetical protein AAF417_22955 [Pseudomonadota bacterium]